MTASGTLLISMPEIAELARVRRPVVTTWRRRHADFPAPAKTEAEADGGHPMFDAHAVVDWLTATGRAARQQIEPELRLYLLRCLGDRLPARLLVSSTTALICLRHLGADEPLATATTASGSAVVNLGELRRRALDVDPDDLLLRSEVEALGPEANWLAPAVDELVEAAWGTSGAFERLLAVRNRLSEADVNQNRVVPELARLIATVSGAREQADAVGSVRVSDPSAGPGDLLVAVLAAVGEAGHVSVSGAEPDRYLARLARRRLVVAGLAVRDVDIRVTAAARSRTSPGRADSVVAVLPYQPGEGRSSSGAADVLAAVRRVGDGLGPGQTAVLLGPADVLVDGLPTHQSAVLRRDELLTTGLVEAIVHLPGGMLPFRPGYRTALWVLRREDPSPWRGRVLLADLTDRPLTDRVVDDLVLDVVTWRREGYRPDQHRRVLSTQARVAALLTGSRRHPVALVAPGAPDPTAARGAEAVARVGDLELGLADLAGEAARATTEPLLAGARTRVDEPLVATTTIARLAAERVSPALRILRGNRLAEADVRTDGAHRVIGPPELMAESRPGDRRIDRLVLAESYPNVTLTEPDDLVVTVVPRFGVYVDTDGFSVVAFPAKALRITESGRGSLTPRVLAALLAAAAPTGRAPSAVRAPRRIEDFSVPILLAEVVERFDTLLAAAEDRRRRAGREIDMVDELCRTTAAGLAAGTLTLTAPETAT